ncbi:MAG: ATP-grasp ribosomal peptide maturase, partial [Actinobacteria bacterium]|nr:ATP-grasp ribosomal peptide maturase [Actinomycetota bacterium]
MVDELHTRGVPVFRCNPGDFPRSLSLSARLGEGWAGSLRLPEREVSVTDIGCAWYRRPTAFEFPATLSAQERRWATTEARLGVGGFLAALPRWLNHPCDIARVEYKPLQLASARTVGLTVPDTLITNDPDEARRFAKEHGDIIYKLFSSLGVSEQGQYRVVYANRITADDITDTVTATIHLFQQWIPKAFEVRLTVVDDDLFAVRIDAGSQAAMVDWRTDYAHLRYSEIAVPEAVREGVLNLLEVLMLRFAALDFVVAPDNEWVFLEANPNGQWAWLQ